MVSEDFGSTSFNYLQNFSDDILHFFVIVLTLAFSIPRKTTSNTYLIYWNIVSFMYYKHNRSINPYNK